MNLLDGIGLTFAVILFIYLVTALLAPEKFE